MTKVYGYIRHSKDEQGRRMSPALQRRDIEAYAKAHGLRVTSWHTDSVTGKTPIAKRPALRALWAKLQRGDILIVWRLDRLSRARTEDQLRLHREAAKLGARIVSTMGEGTNLNGEDDDPDAEFFKTIQIAHGHREIRVLGQRIRAGIRAKKAAGRKWNAEPRYGYRWRDTGKLDENGKPIIVLVEKASEQKTIQMMHDLDADGLSLKEIADELKKRRRVSRGRIEKGGIRQPGGPFTRSMIQRILAREQHRA